MELFLLRKTSTANEAIMIKGRIAHDGNSGIVGEGVVEVKMLVSMMV